MKELKKTNYKDSEKWLEKELTRRVKLVGGKALKFASQTEIGYPDRLVLIPTAKTFWVELKSKGEKPRPIQVIRHDELISMGFDVSVISTEQQLINFINKITNGNSSSN